MSEQPASYSKGFIIGAIFGGAIGAITALLLAPKSGKELRQGLAEKSQELYGKATEYSQNLQENFGNVVSTTVNEGKNRAQSIIKNAKKQAEVLLQNAEKVLNDAREKASETKENIQSKVEDLRDAVKAGADAFKNEMNSNES